VTAKRSRGRPIKVENAKAFLLRLPANLHDGLLKIAKTQSRSLNDILLEVIEEWYKEANETHSDTQP
jgi:predicted HicB family RNase H-like nuclease